MGSHKVPMFSTSGVKIIYLNVNLHSVYLPHLYYTCKLYAIPYRTRIICTLSVLHVGLKMVVSTAETCRHALN